MDGTHSIFGRENYERDLNLFAEQGKGRMTLAQTYVALSKRQQPMRSGLYLYDYAHSH